MILDEKRNCNDLLCTIESGCTIEKSVSFRNKIGIAKHVTRLTIRKKLTNER